MQQGQGAQARFLRKKRQQGGYDSQQDIQDRQFHENLERAVNQHSKNTITNNLQKQVQYFGHKIQPFNMRQQEAMGQIDADGFFLFNRKRATRDAWLDSLGQNDDDQAVQSIRKRIKHQNRQQRVDEGDKVDENQEQSSSSGDQQQQAEQQIIEQDKEDKLGGNQIKMLLAQLLPFGSNANRYMKQLKKQKDQQLYDKVLYLCNEYISITGQHDIMTLTKQQLEQAIQSQQQQPQEEVVQNWDKSQDEQDDIF